MKMLKQSIATLDTRIGERAATKRIVGRDHGKIRKRIMLRDNYTCQKCGQVTAHGEVDHITPLFMGGAECDDNREYLCVECHQIKSDEEEKGRNENG
ncbi:MAG: HNH endonuclease [Smithella sp.]